MKNIVNIVGIIGVIVLSTPVFADNETQIAVRIKQRHELSAIGIKFTNSVPHTIYYIDQNCDLVQQLKIGDVLVAENGEDPMRITMKKQNFGSDNTLVNVTIARSGYILNFVCKRKPIRMFAGWAQQELMHNYNR
jgi:hypothetical protein